MQGLWLLLALAGVILIPLAVNSAINTRRTWAWPTTTVSISKVDVPRTYHRRNSEGPNFDGYRLRFEIKYEIAGASHHQSVERIWGGEISSDLIPFLNDAT
jgi:hypothetical protein